MKKKVALILTSANFFALLSDGIQTRKTKSDKEIVLIRVERYGILTYFAVSLLEMAEYGGTDASSLKEALDSLFAKEGQFPLILSSSLTADG